MCVRAAAEWRPTWQTGFFFFCLSWSATHMLFVDCLLGGEAINCLHEKRSSRVPAQPWATAGVALTLVTLEKIAGPPMWAPVTSPWRGTQRAAACRGGSAAADPGGALGGGAGGAASAHAQAGRLQAAQSHRVRQCPQSPLHADLIWISVLK